MISNASEISISNAPLLFKNSLILLSIKFPKKYFNNIDILKCKRTIDNVNAEVSMLKKYNINDLVNQVNLKIKDLPELKEVSDSRVSDLISERKVRDLLSKNFNK